MLYRNNVRSDKTLERIAEQEKLAEKPIRVSCSQVHSYDGSLRIDTKQLLDGLKYRKDVGKKFGRSFVKIAGVIVPITPLRKWVQVVMIDPKTGKRYQRKSRTSFSTAELFHYYTVGLQVGPFQRRNMWGLETGPNPGEKNSILFTSYLEGSGKIQTTFWDQTQTYVETPQSVLHEVELVFPKFVKDEDIPEVYRK